MPPFLFPLVVLGLLIWSYFARPIYDFAWIVAGRISDRLKARLRKPLLRLDRERVIAKAWEQGDQISAYLQAQRASEPNATTQAFIAPNAEAGRRSAEDQRELLRENLGFPPPGFEADSLGPVIDTLLGQDDVVTYHELSIPALPGIHAGGILALPLRPPRSGKYPLIVAAHWRGDKPDATPDGKIPFVERSGRNLIWDAVQRGYAVWRPTFVHYGRNGVDLRDRLTVQAWQVGTSLPAIEIAKLIKSLDALLQRPDLDATQVAMMGISYGGFYTLFTTALEPRIRVAVVAAYLNDRASVLDASEPHGFLDWRFPNSLRLWTDPTIVALVAPRPLLILAGNQDQLFPIVGARRTAQAAAQVYRQLGVQEHFRFCEFVGRHDFNGPQAIDFIDRHLRNEAN